MKKYISKISFGVIFLSIIASIGLNSFTKKATAHDLHVNWITDFADLESKMKAEPRPIMIDIHTKWCGPCIEMKKKVFSKQKLINYINENYYAVYLDAERQDKISFRGKEFTWSPNRMGGYNQIADYVTDNNTKAYPTIVIMDKSYNVKYAKPKYHTVSDMMYTLSKYNK